MENVEGEIESLAELPQIPFTNPIKRKIQEALGPETEPETNSSKKSKKRAKKPVSEAESSTSTTFPRKKEVKKKQQKDTWIRRHHQTIPLRRPYQTPVNTE